MFDRGTNPRKVISMIIEWKRQGYNIITLRGNHEDMMLAALKLIECPERISQNEIEEVFIMNGGDKTLKHYKDGVPPKSHIDFLMKTKVYHKINGYIFVHAGLKPEVELSKQTYWDMLWIRDEFIESNYDFGSRVIFGHTPHHEPFVDEYKIGIDTGAVFTKRGYGILTCVKLPEEEFIQV